MSVGINSEVVGIKNAIRSLNKIEPNLRKQFKQELTQIAQPAFEEARRRYTFQGWGKSRVTGVSRVWAGPAVRGRRVFPFALNKAVRGLSVKLEGDRRIMATILLQQMDAGSAILETAGRKTQNRLGFALGPLKPNHTRVIGPAAYSKKREITEEIRKAATNVVARVNRELR